MYESCISAPCAAECAKGSDKDTNELALKGAIEPLFSATFWAAL